MIFSNYDIERIQEAKRIIDADISRHYTIDDIALQVALGKTKLKQGFRIHYGKGLYTYLRDIRMSKAMDLVTGSNKTFKEIAKACGFRYYSNFIAAFTRYYRLTPGHARRRSNLRR